MPKLNGLEQLALDRLRDVLGEDIKIIAQDNYLPGTPDFVIDDLKLVIQVDGAFFHDINGKMTRLGIRQILKNKNSGLSWIKKAAENKKRDRDSSKKLKNQGFKVVRLKENRIRSKNAVEYISRAIGFALLN